MFGLYFANKWKSHVLGSEILNNQRLSTISVIHKFGYPTTSQKNWKVIRKYRVLEDKKKIRQKISVQNQVPSCKPNSVSRYSPNEGPLA